jgi:hypothetical protein
MFTYFYAISLADFWRWPTDGEGATSTWQLIINSGGVYSEFMPSDLLACVAKRIIVADIWWTINLLAAEKCS